MNDISVQFNPANLKGFARRMYDWGFVLKESRKCWDRINPKTLKLEGRGVSRTWIHTVTNIQIREVCLPNRHQWQFQALNPERWIHCRNLRDCKERIRFIQLRMSYKPQSVYSQSHY